MAQRNLYTFDKFFFNSDTPESFYVAGIIAADGCVYQKRKIKEKNRANYLTLLLKEEDKDHLDKIRCLLKWSRPLNKKICRNSKTNINYIDKIQYYFQIGSEELCKTLMRFGIGERKSLTYQMPEWLLNHNLINYFLLGYFDGDGCISFNEDKKKLQIHIAGTKIFLEQFNQILVKNNISDIPNKKLSMSKKIHMLSFNGIPKCLKIYEFLLGTSTISLKRKNEIFNRAVDFVKNKERA